MEIWQRFRRNRLAVVGAGLLLVMSLVALFAPQLAPYDPEAINAYDRFLPPLSPGHVLGTDELGRDLWTRLQYAGRVSLLVGLSTAVITFVVGSLVGLVSGYARGYVDAIMTRLIDVMLCFPTSFLLLAVAAFVGPTLTSITLIISFTSWMPIARIVRGDVLSLRERDFVLAARALGSHHFRIIFRHLLPNVMGPILITTTLNVARAILTESYMSFLGFGIQPPIASWGNMLTNAQSYLLEAPWAAIFPGVAIAVTVLAFNTFGDGLRDALDPRLKQLR